jgi:hypothetical protein
MKLVTKQKSMFGSSEWIAIQKVGAPREAIQKTTIQADDSGVESPPESPLNRLNGSPLNLYL